MGQPSQTPLEIKAGTVNWVQDIADMHGKFNVNSVVQKLSADQLFDFLKFRIDFLDEELTELRYAYAELKQLSTHELQVEDQPSRALKLADDTVDALIDLCVVAIGTLDAFGINSQEAWARVHTKNMQKEVGVNANRPNPLGLPDLIKPQGWAAPSHTNNIGLLQKLI